MIRMIVAVGTDNLIGVGPHLPWVNIPEDMKHFRTVTEGGIVVMGRKTYSSIPEKFRPLPKRVNAVLSKDPTLPVPESVEMMLDLNTARFVQLANKYPDKPIWVIGGAQLYNALASSPLLEEAYITHVASPSYDVLPDNFYTADLESLRVRGYNPEAVKFIRELPEGVDYRSHLVRFDPTSLASLPVSTIHTLCHTPLGALLSKRVRKPDAE